MHIKEAAVLCRQHESTIRRHVKEGRLAAVRLGPGGHILIPNEAIQDFVRPVVSERQED